MATYTVEQKRDTWTYNETEQRSYTVSYAVISDQVDDTNIYAAKQATGLPRRGNRHPHDRGCFVSKVNCTSIEFAEDSTLFIFEIEYTTPQLKNPNISVVRGTSEINIALHEPPQVSTSTVRYSVPFAKAYKDGDSQGNPTKIVQNSAGDPFYPVPMTVRVNTLIDITYNKRNFHPQWVSKFVNTINKSGITVVGVSADPLCARLNDLGARINYTDTGEKYWKIHASIEISGTPFKKEILDAGYNAKGIGSEEPVEPIYIYDGAYKRKSELSDDELAKAEKPSDPVKLDGSGDILSSGDPKYLEFQEYFATEWKPLDFPKTVIDSSN